MINLRNRPSTPMTKKVIEVAGRITIAFVFLLPISAAPQDSRTVDSLRREITEVKQLQAAILRELREMRQQGSGRRLAGAPSVEPLPSQAPLPPIDASGQALGSPDAKVTIVEFSDYQCPFCGRFFRSAFRPLVADYVNSGQVRYVVKDFPIESIHPFAVRAAEAAHCAGDQGKYWDMHDLLYETQQRLTPALIDAHAGTIGLDVKLFGRCLDGKKHAATVRRGLEEGERMGVSGTPAFFIGITKPGEKEVRPLYVVRGAKSYSEFRTVIDAALARATTQAQAP